LLGDALLVLTWKPWMVRWLSGVLARLYLTGDRERAREGVVADWYVFAGDRERILAALFSLLAVFMLSVCWSGSLNLPRGSGGTSSSEDSLRK
jgi:hypothetical protein